MLRPATARPLDGGGQGHLHRRIAALVVELPGEDHVDEGAPAGAAVWAAAVHAFAIEKNLQRCKMQVAEKEACKWPDPVESWLL